MTGLYLKTRMLCLLIRYLDEIKKYELTLGAFSIQHSVYSSSLRQPLFDVDSTLCTGPQRSAVAVAHKLYTVNCLLTASLRGNFLFDNITFSVSNPLCNYIQRIVSVRVKRIGIHCPFIFPSELIADRTSSRSTA